MTWTALPLLQNSRCESNSRRKGDRLRNLQTCVCVSVVLGRDCSSVLKWQMASVCEAKDKQEPTVVQAHNVCPDAVEQETSYHSQVATLSYPTLTPTLKVNIRKSSFTYSGWLSSTVGYAVSTAEVRS